MPHLVNAAKTLIRQVEERRNKPGITPGTEPDGLNRIRSVEFDAKTSKWLAPILEACDDPRVAALDTDGKHRLTVTFVASVKADNPDEFDIDEADGVLNS